MRKTDSLLGDMMEVAQAFAYPFTANDLLVSYHVFYGHEEATATVRRMIDVLVDDGSLTESTDGGIPRYAVTGK
jgi:hypothetical protein